VGHVWYRVGEYGGVQSGEIFDLLSEVLGWYVQVNLTGFEVVGRVAPPFCGSSL
jgi:hypothetical protein